MPDVRFRVFVPGVDPLLDGFSEVGNAGVGASSKPFRGEFSEPPFDEVHP